MNKEKKLIPELRFPEFVNEGEWNMDVLGALVDIKGRIGYRGYTTADIVKEGEGAITLSPSNFDEYGNLNFEKCTYITWDKYEESPEIQLEEGQTVLVKTASVGKNAYVTNLPEKATVNPQIVVLKPKKIQNRFLAYTISHYNILNQIRNCVGVGAIPNLSQESISKFVVLIPPDKEQKEQQKIASCLSSIDEVIAAHNQKLKALKDHKKGLMQNLFPQEGETIPKYRFPEFVNDGEWVEKELSELGNLINGLTYSPNDVREKGLLVLRSSNIQNGLIDLNDCVYVRPDINGANISQPNDILVCVRNGSKSLIGKNAIIPKGIQLATHGAFMTVLRAKIPEFVFQLFQTEAYDKQVKADLGATINSINGKNFLKYEFLVPKNHQEQLRIASCLSLLDELITAQAQKIDQLQLHKKGLMQGLFPKIDN
jgi:type I restriction enzyme S subunit